MVTFTNHVIAGRIYIALGSGAETQGGWGGYIPQ